MSQECSLNYYRRITLPVLSTALQKMLNAFITIQAAKIIEKLWKHSSQKIFL